MRNANPTNRCPTNHEPHKLVSHKPRTPQTGVPQTTNPTNRCPTNRCELRPLTSVLSLLHVGSYFLDIPLKMDNNNYMRMLNVYQLNHWLFDVVILTLYSVYACEMEKTNITRHLHFYIRSTEVHPRFLEGWCCAIFSFLCIVLQIIAFLLTIVLSVLLRFKVSYYPFDIFKFSINEEF